MVGVLDETKAILIPAGAWLWAELGNRRIESVTISGMLVVRCCAFLFQGACARATGMREAGKLIRSLLKMLILMLWSPLILKSLLI